MHSRKCVLKAKALFIYENYDSLSEKRRMLVYITHYRILEICRCSLKKGGHIRGRLLMTESGIDVDGMRQKQNAIGEIVKS